MPGTYIKPRAFNRRIFINIGTQMVPQWAEIAVGISSRGVTFTENEEEYYYMSERGTAEKEPTTQSVSRSFTGNRFVGDAAQDAIFIDRLYALDNREVEYIEFYDNITGKANGWRGRASITVSDDGSGDVSSRESIGFGLSYNGKPQRGTVALGEDGVPVFTPEVA